MNIFGILNVTPDSFSDGGNYVDLEQAKKQVKKMIEDGATVIDVGGESTRPGASFVDAQTEISRVVPVIKMIKKNFDIEVSIDTYKSEVAYAAVIAGATIINDVKANSYDHKMLEIVKNHNIKYIAMHSFDCDDVMQDIYRCFNQIINEFKEMGISDSKLILDPGVGFNKDINDNIKIMNNLKKMKSDFSSFEFLLGTSRKRFIGSINNLEVANERVIGTVVTSVLAYQANFEYVRVHDVLENKQAIEILEAFENAK